MTQKTLMSRLDKAYMHVKEELKAKLGKVYSVCTTADNWTVSNRSFFGMTCHWKVVSQGGNHKVYYNAMAKYSALWNKAHWSLLAAGAVRDREKLMVPHVTVWNLKYNAE